MLVLIGIQWLAPILNTNKFPSSNAIVSNWFL
jgi:hypothetical protein